MKLAVVGSRDFQDKDFMFSVLDIYRTQENLTEIVTGGARGADRLAEDYSVLHYPAGTAKIFLAKWEEIGKSAGYIRNIDIWEYADEGVAFWDGKSKGTEHSFKLAKKYKKTLLVFKDRSLIKFIKNGEEMPLEDLSDGKMD